jgi:TonB family protein
VVGQPVPLDSPDPNYREYLQKVRQRIYAHWRFPNEAHNREINARLVVEFHIGKDGQLLKADIVEPSNEHLLDISAMSAVKAPEGYPPLPDSMRRDVLPVVAVFTVRIRTSQSSVFQHLQ